MSNKKINPLHEKLAALYRLSSTNSKLSHLVTEAKTALGITAPKRLTDSEQQAIYDWHVVKTISQPDNSHIVKHISQVDDNQSVVIISQLEDNQSVKTISQSESVEIISQSDFDTQTVTDSVTVIDSVKTISQPEDVNIISQLDDSIRFAFYSNHTGTRKREVIALETFFVEALLLATGIDKTGVAAWIQTAIDSFTGFSHQTGITKQVKYLIVRELTHQLKISKG